MSKNHFVWGSIFGGVVGSVTALLVAPKAGKELRTNIVVQARQVTDKSRAVAEKVGGQSTELYGKAKQKTQGFVTRVQSFRLGKGGVKDVEEAVVYVSSTGNDPASVADFTQTEVDKL
ncbi:gas vesicle protein [Paenibacillus shirakamiensis]|uniref:Gas vesicle protein n=1 Tax=Paenibacillus shirakamiensis TaxID=1265935 RepID=A0ABS4JI20_9BACL|nr:YtxH domain-containing protein [Paenibacillus shirakamiensis]MBP2001337.1 gas vesicle protein [Paenibacillus shirakamiensis]